MHRNTTRGDGRHARVRSSQSPASFFEVPTPSWFPNPKKAFREKRKTSNVVTRPHPLPSPFALLLTRFSPSVNPPRPSFHPPPLPGLDRRQLAPLRRGGQAGGGLPEVRRRGGARMPRAGGPSVHSCSISTPRLLPPTFPQPAHWLARQKMLRYDPVIGHAVPPPFTMPLSLRIRGSGGDRGTIHLAVVERNQTMMFFSVRKGGLLLRVCFCRLRASAPGR